MKFTIGEKVIPKYKNEYAIEMILMWGDADGYENFEIGGFKYQEEEHLLEEVVAILIEAKRGIWADDRNGSYDSIENFSKWFSEGYEECSSEEEWNRIGDILGMFCWRYEEYCGYPYKLDHFSVFYYDENHQKHYVHLTNK